MNIVIAGAGKVGHTIAERLCREGHDITLIDEKRDKLDAAANAMDVLGCVGNCAAPSVLKEAEAGEADVFIAATGNDEANLVACQFARTMGAGHTIVRLRNQMQVLCESSSDSVVFVHPDPKHTVRYEVVVHGLRDVMGWDAAEFQKRLNDGSFLQCFDLPEERKDRTRYYLFQGRLREMNDTCTVRLPGREPIRLQCRFDQVKDDTLNALCIIVFSLAK